tara:strand:+ start:399 stop:620 length:222 start_codon:yes stop_codon:yes gene_type:complete
MKLNEKKISLIKKLHNANYEVFEKVHHQEAFGDVLGFDDIHYSQALSYVPNHILKKWIKRCKEEVKKVIKNNA